MNPCNRIGLISGIVSSLLIPVALRANVKVPAIFSDHMVLQQQMPVPVWGTASPGEEVTVTFRDQKQTATADNSGKWQLKLKELEVGEPGELKVEGKNSVAFHDVLVGEVWVCSGQSNMEMGIGQVKDAQQEIASADYPKIRLFTVPKHVSVRPMNDIAPPPRAPSDGHWLVCSPQTVAAGGWGGFSAVAYFFGRDLHKQKNVPVGLIHTSWGGTPAESWLPVSYLKDDSDFAPITERWAKQLGEFDQKLKDVSQKIESWQGSGAKLEDAPDATLPQDPRTNPWWPSGLYNAMIHPIVPFAIRGATWYQGESNAGRAYQYRKLLPAMIKSWRDSWNEGEFPFLIVSLANFTPVAQQPGDSDWAELREAQAMTAAQPHNAQALAIDIGDANDIHPKDKQTVGARLALAARAIAYGEQIEFSGPWYDSMKIEGDTVRINFKHVDGGLMAKDGETVKGFAIAGEDHKWHWADAKIDGSSVIVHSDQVQHPAAVRYAWANNPTCNLYNKDGLPAVPFRTDDWKGVTADVK